MRTLTECEYCWRVCVVSKDDGHNIVDSYWLDAHIAAARANKIGGTYHQAVLWRDNDNRYYHVDAREVLVNPPTREEVLSKLTYAEQKVLGLC